MRSARATSRYLALLLVSAAALLFVRLGTSEIEPWDEGLYVHRAQSIVAHGDWVDQTSHSLGGLYSLTHPPLGVWCMAATASVFGVNEWTLRLPGAILGVASCLLLFTLLRRFNSQPASLIATLTVLTSGVFLHLVRHAQLDTYLFFFSVFSLWLLTRDRAEWKNVVLAGIACGLALLSKFGFALLFAPLLWLVPRNRSLYQALGVIAIGVLIAAPWYIYMSVVHADFGLHALSVATTAGYESSNHAWWYYLNQLIVACPLIVAAFALFRKEGASESVRLAIPLVFVAAVLIAMATTEPHYVLLFLLPAAFVVARGVDDLLQSTLKVQRIMVAVIAISVGWSMSEQIRLLLRNDLHSNLILPIPEIVLGLSVAVLAVVLTWRSRSSTLIVLCGLLGAVVGQRFYRMLTVPSDYSGIKSVTARLDELRPKNILVVTGEAPHEELAPQFAYYAEAVGVARYSTIKRNSVELPGGYDAVVVEHRKERLAQLAPSETALRLHVDSALNPRFKSALRTSAYTLYYSTP